MTGRHCHAPDLLGSLHCERPTGHPGQHWADRDGERYRWGPRSGATQPEGARAARQVLLRLDPLTTLLLDAYAEHQGITRSQAVARLVLSACVAEGLSTKGLKRPRP